MQDRRDPRASIGQSKIPRCERVEKDAVEPCGARAQFLLVDSRQPADMIAWACRAHVGDLLNDYDGRHGCWQVNSVRA